MRTVDPDLWYRSVRKRIHVTRPMRYGQKVVDNLETRVRRSCRDAMAEFWRNCSLDGFRNIMDEDTSPMERHSHVCLLLATIIASACIVLYNYLSYRSAPPLLVTLQSSQHSIQQVPFPAVAICSYNVISRQALEKFTDYIYSKDQNHTYPRQVIHQHLLKFADLLTLTSPSIDMGFMTFLSLVVGENNVTNIMYRLAPRCENLVRRCSWRGRSTACERLFAARITPVGYCCVFNGRYLPSDYNNVPKILDLVGQDNGLSAAVTENSEDFTYLRRPAVGVEVLLFNGEQYPLLESGSVSTLPAARNSSTYFSLSARVEYPAEGLETYNEDWRGCRMPGRTARRSYAWCLTACRRSASAALCGCVPHTLLPRKQDVVCTPTHLACLNKHREKMSYYYPGDVTDPGLNEELTDSMYCPQCKPDCARTVYSATVSESIHSFGMKSFRNFFSREFLFANVTVIRMFYSTEDQQLYTVETNLRWFEVISSMGSQWLAVGGVTLLSVSELLFHLLCRWPRLFLRAAPRRAP